MCESSIEIHDTTLRDGAQSLWAMRMSYGAIDAVTREMDQAGFSAIEVHVGAGAIPVRIRFFNEDPWETFRMIERNIQNTPIQTNILGMMMKGFGPPEPVAIVRFHIQTIARLLKGKWKRTLLICNTRDEITREYPTLFPILREYGVEPIPYITYTVSPRHTDAFYADVARQVMKFEPVGVCLKDVGGLLTQERARTLIPIIMNEINGTPLEIHAHGMSGLHTSVFAEAMKLGVRRFQCCIPPLAYGSSHPSVYNTIENARWLGLTNRIDLEQVKKVEERLTLYAKQESLPIGVPLPYCEGTYSHQVPGGVISNLVSQLQQLGIDHRLDEVLEEVIRVKEDLGHPIMITPHSQFIVSQAAVNVASGERYKEVLDCMVEFAVGVYGDEDAGLPYMDQNIKDRFLSTPRAREIAEKWNRQIEESKNVTLDEIRAKYDMAGASDEEFLMYYMMEGNELIKKMRAAGPPPGLYTGKEPLALLLKELSKIKNIGHVHLQQGNRVFDFRQKN